MIPWAKPEFHHYEEKYVKQAMKSLWISDGSFVQRFEKNFSSFLKVKNSLTTSNATAAIHLAFLTLGLKKGDEIILPGFGYMAAGNLAIQMGLKPVFADVDKETFCITTDNIKKQITNKTRLVVIINTYGNVCDLSPIVNLLKKRKITLLEDCAESLGSTYKNKNSGTFADIAIYSFQATKTITTGEYSVTVPLTIVFADKLRTNDNNKIFIHSNTLSSSIDSVSLLRLKIQELGCDGLDNVTQELWTEQFSDGLLAGTKLEFSIQADLGGFCDIIN